MNCQTIDDLTFCEAIATCQTDGCANAGIGLNVWVENPGGHVTCGVCGQPITDIAWTDTDTGSDSVTGEAV